MKTRRIVSFILLCVFMLGSIPVFADAPAAKKLSIQSPSKEMVMGRDELSTMQLAVKATPLDADISNLSWTSKKPEVASVDGDGVVTAKSGGSTKITVTDLSSNKKASITIKVWVLPSSVDIKLSEKTLRVKRSHKLSAKISPSSNVRKADKVLSWFSSDSSVATVNAKGKVTAVAPGKATITVMTVNGETDTCEITVTD